MSESLKMQLNSLLFLFMLTSITHLHSIVYPTKIKDIVSKLTQCTQNCLRDQISRIEVELPPIAEYGIEKVTKSSEISDKDKIMKSNREAARLFTEMFSILSSTTVVLFSTEEEARRARDLWGSSFRGQVFSMESAKPAGYGNLRSRRFSLEEQQQALLSSDGLFLPEDTEVLIISGSKQKDHRRLKSLSERLTDRTAVILLNARLSSYAEYGEKNETVSVPSWLLNRYVNAFHYAPPIKFNAKDAMPPPQEQQEKEESEKKEYLMYHEYNQPWYLLEKEINRGFLSSVVGGSFKSVSQGDRRDDVLAYTTNIKPI